MEMGRNENGQKWKWGEKQQESFNQPKLHSSQFGDAVKSRKKQIAFASRTLNKHLTKIISAGEVGIANNQKFHNYI